MDNFSNSTIDIACSYRAFINTPYQHWPVDSRPTCPNPKKQKKTTSNSSNLIAQVIRFPTPTIRGAVKNYPCKIIVDSYEINQCAIFIPNWSVTLTMKYRNHQALHNNHHYCHPSQRQGLWARNSWSRATFWTQTFHTRIHFQGIKQPSGINGQICRP